METQRALFLFWGVHMFILCGLWHVVVLILDIGDNVNAELFLAGYVNIWAVKTRAFIQTNSFTRLVIQRGVLAAEKHATTPQGERGFPGN